MNRIIATLSLLMIISITAKAEKYTVYYKLEEGSVLLVHPSTNSPETVPTTPPVETPKGPLCSYSEDASNKTMWINGATSYYKVFAIYNEGKVIMESTNGSVDRDSPKLINGVLYTRGSLRFDSGQYPRYELCVEKK